MRLSKITLEILGSKNAKAYLGAYFSVDSKEIGDWVKLEKKGEKTRLTSEFGLNLILQYRVQELKDYLVSEVPDLLEKDDLKLPIKQMTSKKKYRYDMSGRKHRIDSMTGKKKQIDNF